VPVAENCCLVLTGSEDAAGETVRPVRLLLALVTATVALDFIVPDVAVTVTMPFARAIALPAATDTTLVSDEVHCADVVRSFELPSLYFPVAVNCWLPPVASELAPGEI
jgi:hypothetical protein